MDAEAWGVDPAEFATPEPEGVEVWPWHLPALRAWGIVSGQWRVASLGGGMVPCRLVWLGLDAAGAKAALDLSGETLAAGVWEMIQAIASGAAEELNGP